MVPRARNPPDQLVLSARFHEMGQDVARAVTIHEAGDALSGELVVVWELSARAIRLDAGDVLLPEGALFRSEGPGIPGEEVTLDLREVALHAGDLELAGSLGRAGREERSDGQGRRNGGGGRRELNAHGARNGRDGHGDVAILPTTVPNRTEGALRPAG